MAETVEWRVKNLFKADPNKVNAEIQCIGDKVSPSDILEYARHHKKSELHKCFTWDDSVAAEKYRMIQAQTIIRCIVIVQDKPDATPLREYSLTTEEKMYAPTRSFLVNQDEYENLLKQALAELETFKRKYKSLTELDAIFAAINEIQN